MKYMMFTVIFALVSIAALTQTQTSGPASQDQSGSQKVIKDPSEYNAYVAALGIKDPAQKAAAMEAFVKQYPQTIMLAEALEEAMAGYEKAGNSDKVEEMAKRILQVTPSQINALAVLVALDRNKVNGGDQAPVKEMCAATQTGLQQLPNWQKPDGMADSDYASAKKQMTDIFNGASGFCTLQNKDYVNARSFYQKALQIEIDAAITDDNKAANKADVHVVMEKPLLRPPATGTITDITGVITKYTPDPFMFTMEQGSVPGKTSSTPRRPARPAAAQKPAA